MNKLISLLFFPLVFWSIQAKTQNVPYAVGNQSVYSFLDEMAELQFIDLNSAIKPFSRNLIATKLLEIKKQQEILNRRQRFELDFFLKDFNKELHQGKEYDKRLDLFYFKDSLFTFSVNPILGIQYWSNENGSATHWWNGAEAFAYVGKHWAFYANLRDNHDKQFLSRSNYLNQVQGAAHKGNGDYSEMRGGVTYTWKWGSAGLVKDNFTWGNNYNGANIFSGKTPSFAQIYLKMKPVKWFEFNYVHGWLVSEVVDSSRSYWFTSSYGTTYRKVFHPKYIAANLFTFTPIKRLHLSFGNSIVYTDLGVFPAYLIPIAFYKSIDHTVNHNIDNQNSQMFFDFSSRQIKHFHVYSTLFMDELSTTNLFNKDKQSNFFSWKIGGKLSDFPLNNLALTIEFTRTNPLAFQHYVPTLEYTSNQYNLGFYLKDNSREWFLALEAKPLRGLWIQTSFCFAQKGPDYDRLGGDRLGLPFLESIEWESKTFLFKARYEIINDGFVVAQYQNSNITGNDLALYTHPLWWGHTHTFSLGMNFGF